MFLSKHRGFLLKNKLLAREEKNMSILSGLSKIYAGAVDAVCDTTKGVVNTAKNTTYSVGSLLSGNTDKAAQYGKAAVDGVTDTFKNGAAAVGKVVEGTAQLTEGTLDVIQQGAHALDDFIPSQNAAETETNEATMPPETPIEVIETKDLPPMFETAPTTTAKAEEAKNPKPAEVAKQPTQSANKGGKLKLDVMEAYDSTGNATQLLNENDEEGNNYYRANDLFANIKKETQKTQEVEEVVAQVIDELGNPTAEDAKAFHIAGKSAGVSGYTEMAGKGKGTAAYNMFLDINDDDFTTREVEKNGKKETIAFLDKDKTDGEITVFGSEIVGGKEYLTLVDKDGKAHYFDKDNQLSEIKLNPKFFEN